MGTGSTTWSSQVKISTKHWSITAPSVGRTPKRKAVARIPKAAQVEGPAKGESRSKQGVVAASFAACMVVHQSSYPSRDSTRGAVPGPPCTPEPPLLLRLAVPKFLSSTKVRKAWTVEYSKSIVVQKAAHETPNQVTHLAAAWYH